MSEHSKEPWVYQWELGGGTVNDINGLRVASTMWSDDARRIVACVNALAGVPIEDIEGYGWRDGAPLTPGAYWLRRKIFGTWGVAYPEKLDEIQLQALRSPGNPAMQHAIMLIGPPPEKEGER